MIRWMRFVFPSARWVSIIVVIFGLFYLCVEVMYRACFLVYRLPPTAEIVQDFAEFRRGSLVALFGLACISYGVCRVFVFHPFARTEYGRWLQSMPWTSRKPLPLGPVHLVWQDLVVIVALGLLGIWGLKLPWFAPLLLVLLPYLFCMTLALGCTGEHALCYALAFGFGWLILFSEHLTGVSVLAVALYPLAFIGLRRSLKRFPWEIEEDAVKAGIYAADLTSRRDKTPALGLLSQRVQNQILSDLGTQSARMKRIGWPFDKLNPQESLSAVSRIHSVLISLVVGWYLYSVNGIPGVGEWDSGTLWGLRIVTGFLALARVGAYCGGYSPPIGFFGRILTGRWIIPGYDRVFVAPLCAVLTSFIAPIALRSLGLPLGVAIPVSASLVLMMLIIIGPTLPRWRLTGCHRLVAGTLNRAEFIIL